MEHLWEPGRPLDQGDETVSIALPDGRIVWLFSDMFLGTVNSDYSRPTNTSLSHHSMVVLQGSTLTTITGGTEAAPTSTREAVTNSITNQDWVDDAFTRDTSPSTAEHWIFSRWQPRSQSKPWLVSR